MLLPSPESFTPHDDFVCIILKFTVCCSHFLKAPHNSFLIIIDRAKKEKEKKAYTEFFLLLKYRQFEQIKNA